MLRIVTCALVVTSSLPACGGGTPPAKDETDVASSGDDNGGSASSGASSNDSSSSGPSASSASSSSPSSGSSSAPAASGATASSSTPPATGDASGDIKTAGDDPWLAGHQMPPADVMKTMRRANGKVQACWKAALKDDPSTNGEVKIRFVITNDGKVRVWRDDGSSMSDEDVTKCVGAVVQTLTFPKQKSPGDAWGVYSIHFAP
jgi:hypothetical protein